MIVIVCPECRHHNPRVPVPSTTWCTNCGFDMELYQLPSGELAARSWRPEGESEAAYEQRRAQERIQAKEGQLRRKAHDN